ncbi:MAG: pyrimidine 5'-nucleotidase [Anaerolineales bacterium]
MKFETIFFDLDGTLYDNETGLWEIIRQRMSLYMNEKLGLPWEIIPELRRHYFETYGTTLRGLQQHYQVDADDYLQFVHDIPLDQFLKPEPELHEMIQTLPYRKYVFTNADSNHALRVLNALHLEDCFDGIIDVRAIDFYCKPEPEAYHIALQRAHVHDPQTVVYLDDSINNLSPATQLGMFTILVGQHEPSPAVKLIIPKLKDLRTYLPDLWTNHRQPNKNDE